MPPNPIVQHSHPCLFDGNLNSTCVSDVPIYCSMQLLIQWASSIQNTVEPWTNFYFVPGATKDLSDVSLLMYRIESHYTQDGERPASIKAWQHIWDDLSHWALLLHTTVGEGKREQRAYWETSWSFTEWRSKGGCVLCLFADAHHSRLNVISSFLQRGLFKNVNAIARTSLSSSSSPHTVFSEEWERINSSRAHMTCFALR